MWRLVINVSRELNLDFIEWNYVDFFPEKSKNVYALIIGIWSFFSFLLLNIVLNLAFNWKKKEARKEMKKKNVFIWIGFVAFCLVFQGFFFPSCNQTKNDERMSIEKWAHEIGSNTVFDLAIDVL